MSSGDGNCCFEDPLTGDFVSDEQSEHDVGQPTAQCPQRLGLGVTCRHPSLDVTATGPDATPLRHADPVQRRIDLSVAAAVEAEALAVR